MNHGTVYVFQYHFLEYVIRSKNVFSKYILKINVDIDYDSYLYCPPKQSYTYRAPVLVFAIAISVVI